MTPPALPIHAGTLLAGLHSPPADPPACGPSSAKRWSLLPKQSKAGWGLSVWAPPVRHPTDRGRPPLEPRSNSASPAPWQAAPRQRRARVLNLKTAALRGLCLGSGGRDVPHLPGAWNRPPPTARRPGRPGSALLHALLSRTCFKLMARAKAGPSRHPPSRHQPEGPAASRSLLAWIHPDSDQGLQVSESSDPRPPESSHDSVRVTPSVVTFCRIAAAQPQPRRVFGAAPAVDPSPAIDERERERERE